MHISYSESGSIIINLDTQEDRIIFNFVHGLNEKKALTFEAVDSSTLVCRATNPHDLPFLSAHVLTPEQNKEIIDHIKRREKLMAVKLLKEYTGYGLRESKELIDAYCIENERLLKQP